MTRGMPGFLNVLAPDDALNVLRERLDPRVEEESVATPDALGRVTAEDVRSPEGLPSFPRSTMDGFSVRSADTFGASEGLPAYLEVRGEIPMGTASQIDLSPGQAAKAYTGGMLAGGADAVVMVEHTQSVDANTIACLIFQDGSRPAALGIFTSVSKRKAESANAYTERDGRYWVCIPVTA